MTNVYWVDSKVFIEVKSGRKYLTGLIIEADGWHMKKVPIDEPRRPVLYKGKPYPARKMRGHLRRWKAATKGARNLRNQLLA